MFLCVFGHGFVTPFHTSLLTCEVLAGLAPACPAPPRPSRHASLSALTLLCDLLSSFSMQAFVLVDPSAWKALP